MASKSQSGQVILEFAITSLLFVGLFMLAISASQTAQEQQKRYRFRSSKLNSQSVHIQASKKDVVE